MSLVASVICKRNWKIYIQIQTYFLIQICILFRKKNIILKKFLLGNFFLNFMYEGVLCQVFHLNEATVFYENKDK